MLPTPTTFTDNGDMIYEGTFNPTTNAAVTAPHQIHFNPTANAAVTAPRQVQYVDKDYSQQINQIHSKPESYAKILAGIKDINKRKAYTAQLKSCDARKETAFKKAMQVRREIQTLDEKYATGNCKMAISKFAPELIQAPLKSMQDTHAFIRKYVHDDANVQFIITVTDDMEEMAKFTGRLSNATMCLFKEQFQYQCILDNVTGYLEAQAQIQFDPIKELALRNQQMNF